MSAAMRFGALSSALFLLSLPAGAGELPPVKTSETNAVAQCATPGRLMVFLKDRNPKLAPKYEVIAREYMRHGEALGVRWDYAFFQMLLETGFLTYKGDVKPEQNNFAGLGATGNGARGESFKDVSSGARAHLEHLLMYTGTRVENPVAERTRNIQDWEVLVPWQKTIKGPMTFTQLAKQWAPSTRGYASDIDAIATRFFNGPCLGPDPQPELVADARGKAATAAETAATADAGLTKGQLAAKRAVEAARSEGAQRSALGAPPSETAAQALVPAANGPQVKSEAPVAAAAKPQPKITIINAVPDRTLGLGQSKGEEPAAADKTAPVEKKTAAAPAQDNAPDKANPVAAFAGSAKGLAKADPKADKADRVEVAALGGAAGALAKPDKKSAAGKCRVFTASYGGEKAIIIKATSDKITNFTVLDVNEGSEKREAEAYINAYAKGGEKVGEFSNQSQALEKAFDLCPEG